MVIPPAKSQMVKRSPRRRNAITAPAKGCRNWKATIFDTGRTERPWNQQKYAPAEAPAPRKVTAVQVLRVNDPITEMSHPKRGSAHVAYKKEKNISQKRTKL